MLRTDYHTHTPLCMHADGEPGEFVAAALRMGLHTYGIADHAPMPPEREPFDNWRMKSSDLDIYAQWVEQARTAARGSQLNILCGFECDWAPELSPWIQQLRTRADYLIGSVHYIPNQGAVDDSLYANKSITGSTEQDWLLYWQAVENLIRSGLFDIMGHVDLVKIWGRVPTGDLMAYYEPVLTALEESHMAVELNTAGWHKHCAEQYPANAFLEQLLLRHIPIVINSDAHHPAHLSRDWERGVALLHQLSPKGITCIQHLTISGNIPLIAYGSV